MSILHQVIRETVKQMVEARPTAMGQKPRGLPPFSSWGGRRVYDKETGRPFEVIDYFPKDIDEPVEFVTLRAREGPPNVKKVSYDDFLGNYTRHVGQAVMSPIGSEPEHVRFWAASELGPRGPGYGKVASVTRAHGPVDIDPKTGKSVLLPSPSAATESDPTKFSPKQLMSDPSLKDEPRRTSEEEAVLDKITLLLQMPEFRVGGQGFVKYVRPYLEQYKSELKGTIKKAQRAIVGYVEQMVGSGELDTDDFKKMKSISKSIAFSSVWSLPGFHENVLPSAMLPPHHVSTISMIVARTNKLSVENLDEQETERAIMRDRPGFLVWLSKYNSGSFWNLVRQEAERRGLYRGQF